MAGAIAQVKEASAVASATTIASGSFGSNVTSGNKLVVYATRGTSTGTTTPSKNSGTATIGSFTARGLATEAALDDTLEQWSADITGTGSLDILATFSTSQPDRGIMCVEVSGVSAVDGSDADTDTGSDPTPDSSVTVTTQPAFGVALGAGYQEALNPGSGWTQQGSDVWVGVADSVLQFKAITATGATTCNFANPTFSRTCQAMIVLTDGAPPSGGVSGPRLGQWGRDQGYFYNRPGRV